MRATVTRPGRVLLVAGPRLDHADAEVEALSAIYPDADRLGGSAATVAATLGCLEGATLAHFATHGRHEADNALFSRLDLVDGPLMAYDLQTISAAPRQVVLAACDVGQAVVRPGDELLGFTAALLQAGSGAVVASVARVPDEAARHQTVAYHRALVAGAEPAQALADAMAATDETPAFVCFGAG